MERRYSISEARDHLAKIVHDVEQEGPVELTRRGKAVAVLLSLEDYRRLGARTGTFWEAYERFRSEVDLEDLDLESEVFDGLRDRSPGREMSW